MERLSSQLSARYLSADQDAPIGGADFGLPGFTTSQANRFQNFLISTRQGRRPTSSHRRPVNSCSRSSVTAADA